MTDKDDTQTDTFFNNIMKSFVIVILTIGLIYIRNLIASQEKVLGSLQYLIFGFFVIIFMLVMTSVQGSSFMSLITLIIILISVTMIIWAAAKGTSKTS
tara:strand:+ start:191 stop:487 length:297 start_codon:yes stop_codon:yes gene_type:complete